MTDVPTTSGPKRYDAFVSYSHSADGELAPALQRGLQRFAKPWRQRRALEVFRDETGLAVNPDLWASICTAMDGSEWFVLLCSPDAARSEWVGREIERWVSTRGAGRLLPLVTEGTFVWDEARGDIDLHRSTAAHPALAGVFAAEPRYIDMSWARSETDLTLRNARFRDQVAEVAAPMHGTTKDELEGEDVRQQRRTRRAARGGVTVLALLTVLATASAAVAVLNGREAARQRDEAERQRAAAVTAQKEAERQARVATSQRLADLSGTASGELSLLLAVQGHRMAETPQATGAMIGLLGRAGDTATGRLAGHDGAVVSVAHSVTGSHVATVDSGGSARAFTPTGELVAGPAALNATAATVVNDTLVVATPDGVALVPFGAEEPTDVVDLGSPVRRVTAVGGADGSVLAGTDDGTVALVTGGAVTARLDGAHPDPVRFVGASADGSVLLSFGSVSEATQFGDRQEGGTVVVHDPDDLSATARWSTPGGVLALSRDGSSVATAPTGMDQTDDGVALAYVLDAATGDETSVANGFELYLARAASFTPDGENLVVTTTGGVDGAPGLAQILPVSGTRGDGRSLGTQTEAMWSVSVAPDGSTVVIGASEPAAPVLPLGDEGFGSPIDLDGSVASVPLSVTDDGRYIAVTVGGSGGEATSVGLADLETGETRLVTTTAGDRAAVSPDGTRLLVAEGIIDATSGDAIGATVPPIELGVPPSFSADGGRVAYVVGEAPVTRIAVVDLADGTVVAAGEAPAPMCDSGTNGLGDPYFSCAPASAFLQLSDDGALLVLRPPTDPLDAAAATPVTLVDVVDGWTESASTTTSGGGAVRFDSDGLLVQNQDLVRTYEASGLEPVGGGRRTELSGRWEVDGDGWVSVGTCSVTLMDQVSLLAVAEIPAEVTEVEGGCDAAPDAAWLPGTDVLVTATPCSVADDCPLQRWDLAADRMAEVLCARAGRNLTIDEWGQFLPDWDYEATCDQWPGGDGRHDPADPPATDPNGSTTTGPAPTTTAPPTTDAPTTSEATTTTGGNIGDPATFATPEALIEHLMSLSSQTYGGPCDSVQDQTGSVVCSVEVRRDGDELVIGMGFPNSEVFEYLLLTQGPDGWELTDRGAGGIDTTPPPWVESG